MKLLRPAERELDAVAELSAISVDFSRLIRKDRQIRRFYWYQPRYYDDLWDMKDIEIDVYGEYSQLVDLVAQFDAGKISRKEFQQRVRALPNDQLLILSRILTAGPEVRRFAACTSVRE